MKFSDLRKWIMTALPTLRLFVVFTKTPVDDSLVAALERILAATTPDGVDWNNVRDLAAGSIGFLKVVATLTPMQWDDNLVGFLESLVSGGVPKFAPES